jgi:tripartite ATP-independent transporter DctP family solute receptor
MLAAPALVTRARAQEPVTLRVSSSYPTGERSSHYVWFQNFASYLKSEADDRIRFDYFPNSQLGGEAETVEQVKLGSADMMLTGPSIWATVAPEIGMLDLGYAFDSYAHLGKALDAGAGDALAKILADRTGVKIIGWGFHFGARSVYAKTPVARLADIRNMKLRVLPAPAFVETFKIMGAAPTPIPFNELYTALQTGVVDGFEHDPGTCLALKFYEVTKFCLLTEHLFGAMCAFLGKRAFAKIPDDLKPLFFKAAAHATAEERAVALDKIKAATEEYPATKPIFAAIAAARA